MPEHYTLQSTAVAMLIFNRPMTTQRVFDAVRKARPPRLLIVADGPRPNRSGEATICQAARSIVHQVDWPCEVLTHFSEKNLGCRIRVSSGLDWVFSQVEEAIILEDDCLPHPDFFRYCEKMLARYRDDERVHMVRGGHFFADQYPGKHSYHFSRWYHIWGWASWARAWRYNDVTMQRWPELRESGWLESLLPNPAMVSAAREIFDGSHAHQIDTWEYYWVYSSWLRNALAICPAVNMISNIGFGADATHFTREDHPHSELAWQAMPFPLQHPDSVAVDIDADLQEWRNLNPGQTRIQRMRSGISRRLRKLLAD